MTELRERLRLPDFGGGLRRFLFEPNTTTTRRQIQDRIVKALAVWEPRIARRSGRASRPTPDDPEAAVATIVYRLVATRRRSASSLTVRAGGHDRWPTSPAHRRPQLPGAPRRGARADPGPQPGVDELQPQRPRRHAARAVRVPDRGAAYRANQIPERNRRKFLSLLGVPLGAGVVGTRDRRARQRARAAGDGDARRRARGAGGRGAVPHRRSGSTSCRSRAGRSSSSRWPNPPPELLDYYRQLYASHARSSADAAATSQLYETTPADAFGPAGAALQRTADNSLWIALLLRDGDPPHRRRPRRGARAAAGRARRSASASCPCSPIRRRARRDRRGLRHGPRAARLPAPADRRPAGVLPPDAAPARRALPAADGAGAGQRAARARDRPGRAARTIRTSSGLWANLDPLEAGSATSRRPRGHQARRPARDLAAGQGAVGRARRRCCGRASTPSTVVPARRSRRRGAAATAPASPTRSCGWPGRPVVPGTRHVR